MASKNWRIGHKKFVLQKSNFIYLAPKILKIEERKHLNQFINK